MWFFATLFFLLAIDILGITALPLLFLLLLAIFFKEKRSWIFIFAFLSGLALDVLLIRPFGQTSLFFVIFIFVLLLYGQKFEIQNSSFMVIATFLGELLYLFLFNYNHIVQQALISSLAAFLLWKIIRKITLV